MRGTKCSNLISPSVHSLYSLQAYTFSNHNLDKMFSYTYVHTQEIRSASEFNIFLLLIIINFIFIQDTHVTEVFFSGVLHLYVTSIKLFYLYMIYNNFYINNNFNI